MPMVNKRLPSDSFPGQLNEARSATTAGGGLAVTTTAKFTALLDGSKHIVLIARNFAGGAAVMQVALNPYAMILKTANNLKTVTDYSVVGQSNPADATGVNLNALDTLANGNALYVGAHVPFRGVACTNVSANANASVLLVNYWNGTIWKTLSATDGTASAGATMAQTGNVTWTMPTDWATTTLPKTKGDFGQAISGWSVQSGVPSVPNIPVPPIMESANIPYSERPRYWTQWSVSVALSATVSNAPMLTMNRSTAYAEMVADSLLAFRSYKFPDGIGNIEAKMNSGTGNLIVNCYTDAPNGLFL